MDKDDLKKLPQEQLYEIIKKLNSELIKLQNENKQLKETLLNSN